jgi:hypothetical protein
MASAANPITSVAPPSSSPITSVQPQSYPSYNTQSNSNQFSRLHLDVRGSRFVVERERLMSLPESVLLCLFPNGLVLSRPPRGGLAQGEEQQDVYVVDVSLALLLPSFLPVRTFAWWSLPRRPSTGHHLSLFPQWLTLTRLPPPPSRPPPPFCLSPVPQFAPNCFNYVLDFFQKATLDFYGTSDQPGFYQLQSSLHYSSPNSLPSSPSSFDDDPSSNPLLHKQGIIVLREELEYFVIPARGGEARTDMDGIANESLRELKVMAGKGLLERRQIFTALQRNVNKENNVAEQHLIDMLCQR